MDFLFLNFVNVTSALATPSCSCCCSDSAKAFDDCNWVDTASGRANGCAEDVVDDTREKEEDGTVQHISNNIQEQKRMIAVWRLSQ